MPGRGQDDLGGRSAAIGAARRASRLRRGYEARFFVTGGGLMSSPLRMERQATDVSLTGFDIAQLRLEAAVRDIGMAQLLSEVVTAAIRICGLIVTTGT